MKVNFDLLDATRQNILNTIEGLNISELNKVPKGFSNSIAWNVAHIVVTQQLLHYAMSNEEVLVSSELIAQYRKGTKVGAPISEEDWQIVIDLLKSLALQLRKDYALEKFKNYKVYPTSYGYELANINEALAFNNVHEALHLGYIMSMKKQL
jgi:hypothetical protein